MIEKVIAHSRTTEIDALCTRIIAAFETSENKNDVHLIAIITHLQTISVSLNEAIKRIKTESELEEKDQLRDEAVRNLYYLVKGFAHHPEEKINNAAKRLLEVINNYGLGIVSKSYGIETSLINSLIIELDKPQNSELTLVLSGAVEIVNSIKLVQSNFEASYLAMEKDKAYGVDVETASTIKKEAVQIINGKLVNYLNGMVAVDKASYGVLTQIIGQVIMSNNANIKKRANTTVKEPVEE